MCFCFQNTFAGLINGICLHDCSASFSHELLGAFPQCDSHMICHCTMTPTRPWPLSPSPRLLALSFFFFFSPSLFVSHALFPPPSQIFPPSISLCALVFSFCPLWKSSVFQVLNYPTSWYSDLVFFVFLCVCVCVHFFLTVLKRRTYEIKLLNKEKKLWNEVFENVSCFLYISIFNCVKYNCQVFKSVLCELKITG